MSYTLTADPALHTVVCTLNADFDPRREVKTVLGELKRQDRRAHGNNRFASRPARNSSSGSSDSINSPAPNRSAYSWSAGVTA